MARHKLPKNVHYLKGTDKKDPQRMRERENEPEDTRDLGPAPKSLSGPEKKAWQELVENAIPGVLGQADRQAVEVAAVLMVKFREKESSAAELARLISLLGQFGMTPSERSKINLGGKGKSKNPFADD